MREIDPQRRVTIFFYGSYIIRSLLIALGVDPGRVQVGRAWGYDIRLDPLARLVHSDMHCVYGVVANLVHADIRMLYAAPWMDAYTPTAIMVECIPSGSIPALCYWPDGPSSSPGAGPGYVDDIITAGRNLGFPRSYLDRLETFRPQP
jgi:hypothetical protein